jgi:hyperosmotically inducible periplasmic protein
MYRSAGFAGSNARVAGFSRPVAAQLAARRLTVRTWMTATSVLDPTLIAAGFDEHREAFSRRQKEKHMSDLRDQTKDEIEKELAYSGGNKIQRGTMRPLRVVVPILLSLAITGFGQTAPKADNTDVNKRDRNAGEVTADQQKMNAADRALTQRIRRSVMADKSLSTYAHNIKIISQNGLVTLKGPVKSNAEKQAVIAKAAAVAGADKVTDQISVKQ